MTYRHVSLEPAHSHADSLRGKAYLLSEPLGEPSKQQFGFSKICSRFGTRTFIIFVENTLILLNEVYHCPQLRGLVVGLFGEFCFNDLKFEIKF